ncbi:MAG: TraX family protein [Ruthenibacterium sp.]
MKQQTKGISGFGLKYIAMALMIFDHIHYFFEFTGVIPVWFSMLGRISAPLFLFCLIEGFTHTHDRKRYFCGIYAIAIGMGLFQFVCTYFGFARPDGFYPRNQMLATFVILLVIFQGIDWCAQKQWIRGIAAIVLPLALPYLAFALLSAVPAAGFLVAVLQFSVLPLHTSIIDGGTIVILQGILLYLLRNHRKAQAIGYVLSSLLVNAVLPLVLMPELTFPMLFTEVYEWMNIFAVPLMLCYNGTRGNGSKRLFYWFYPVHIYILFALSWGTYLLLH